MRYRAHNCQTARVWSKDHLLSVYACMSPHDQEKYMTIYIQMKTRALAPKASPTRFDVDGLTRAHEMHSMKH